MVEAQTPGDAIEQQDLVAGGTKIRNKAGDIGIFQGVESEGETEYIKVKFPDHDGSFPRRMLGGRYTVVTEEDAAEVKPLLVEEDRPPEDVQKMVALKKYIRANQDYHSQYEYKNDSLRAAVERILVEAKQKDYVFRGDLRHPYAKGARDRNEGKVKGPFEVGLRSTLSDEKISTTADFSRAVSDPDPMYIFGDWDGTRYLYIIDSAYYLDHPERWDREDLENNKIRSGDIPPEYIKYAFDVNKGTVIHVFTNVRMQSNLHPQVRSDEQASSKRKERPQRERKEIQSPEELTIDYARRLLMLSYRFSQGQEDQHGEIFKYIHARRPKWQMSVEFAKELLEKSGEDIQKFLRPSIPEPGIRNTNTLIHSQYNNVPTDELSVSNIYDSVKAEVEDMQQKFNSDSLEYSIQKIAQQMVERDLEFLSRPEGRPRQAISPNQAQVPIMDPWMSQAIYYGIEGNNADLLLPEFAQMFRDIGAYLNSLTPESAASNEFGQLQRLKEIYYQKHSPERVES